MQFTIILSFMRVYIGGHLLKLCGPLDGQRAVKCHVQYKLPQTAQSATCEDMYI